MKAYSSFIVRSQVRTPILLRFRNLISLHVRTFVLFLILVLTSNGSQYFNSSLPQEKGDMLLAQTKISGSLIKIRV